MQEHSYEHNTDQKVDLELIFRNFLHVLKRTWWWVTLLAILVGALRYVQAQRSFVPQYTATASFSVKSGYVGTTDLVDSTQYYDNQAAEQVVSSFPYIICSEAMQERICLALNTSWINGTVTASSIGETNIFTLTVTSTNPQDAYDILNAVIQNYPQVASFVIGGTQLSMIEEPQVPTVPVPIPSGGPAPLLKVWQLVCSSVSALTLPMAIGRKTVRTADDLKRSTSVPCMGTIPAIQVKRRRKAAGSGVSILNPHLGDTLSVPIGALQVRLLRSQPAGGTGRIILITSTMPGEGKTTVSFNLAASLAQSGKRVILVDAESAAPGGQGAVRHYYALSGAARAVQGSQAGHCPGADSGAGGRQLKPLGWGHPDDVPHGNSGFSKDAQSPGEDPDLGRLCDHRRASGGAAGRCSGAMPLSGSGTLCGAL